MVLADGLLSVCPPFVMILLAYFCSFFVAPLAALLKIRKIDCRRSTPGKLGKVVTSDPELLFASLGIFSPLPVPTSPLENIRFQPHFLVGFYELNPMSTLGLVGYVLHHDVGPPMAQQYFFSFDIPFSYIKPHLPWNV